MHTALTDQSASIPWYCLENSVKFTEQHIETSRRILREFCENSLRIHSLTYLDDICCVWEYDGLDSAASMTWPICRSVRGVSSSGSRFVFFVWFWILGGLLTCISKCNFELFVMHIWNLAHLNIDLSPTSARSQLNVNSEKHQNVLHCRVDSAKPVWGQLSFVFCGCGRAANRAPDRETRGTGVPKAFVATGVCSETLVKHEVF